MIRTHNITRNEPQEGIQAGVALLSCKAWSLKSQIVPLVHRLIVDFILPFSYPTPFHVFTGWLSNWLNYDHFSWTALTTQLTPYAVLPGCLLIWCISTYFLIQCLILYNLQCTQRFGNFANKDIVSVDGQVWLSSWLDFSRRRIFYFRVLFCPWFRLVRWASIFKSLLLTGFVQPYRRSTSILGFSLACAVSLCEAAASIPIEQKLYIPTVENGKSAKRIYGQDGKKHIYYLYAPFKEMSDNLEPL